MRVRGDRSGRADLLSLKTLYLTFNWVVLPRVETELWRLSISSEPLQWRSILQTSILDWTERLFLWAIPEIDGGVE